MVLQEMYTFATAVVQHICEGGGLMSYMAMYMDTIPKLLNHLLFAQGICNIFLLFVSMTGDYALEHISMHAFFISVLLCSQTACVWRILNHGHTGMDASGAIDHFRVFTPSEFLVGVALGITIGGAILSFIVSRFFGQLSRQCEKEANLVSRLSTAAAAINNATTNTVVVNSIYHKCDQYRGSILAVWFWSGMVFWFNLGVAILIAMGRNELTNFYGQYDSIDQEDGGGGGGGATAGSGAAVPPLFPRYQQQQQQQPAPGPGTHGGYSGNYPSVPEVRPGVAPAPTTSWDASTATDPLSSHQHSKPAA